MEENAQIRCLLYDAYQWILNPYSSESRSSLSLRLADFLGWEKNLEEWNLNRALLRSRMYVLESHPDKCNQLTSNPHETWVEATSLYRTIKYLLRNECQWIKYKQFLQCFAEPHTTSSSTSKKEEKIQDIEHWLASSSAIKSTSIFTFLNALGEFFGLETEWYNFLAHERECFLQLVSGVEKPLIFFQLLKEVTDRLLNWFFQCRMRKRVDCYEDPVLRASSEALVKGTTTENKNRNSIGQLLTLTVFPPDFKYITLHFLKHLSLAHQAQLTRPCFLLLLQLETSSRVEIHQWKPKIRWFMKQFCLLLQKQDWMILPLLRRSIVYRQEPFQPDQEVKQTDLVYCLFPPNEKEIVTYRIYYAFLHLLSCVCRNSNQVYVYRNLKQAYFLFHQKRKQKEEEEVTPTRQKSKRKRKRNDPYVSYLDLIRLLGLRGRKIQKIFLEAFRYLKQRSNYAEKEMIASQESNVIFYTKENLVTCLTTKAFAPRKKFKRTVPVDFPNYLKKKGSYTKYQIQSYVKRANELLEDFSIEDIGKSGMDQPVSLRTLTCKQQIHYKFSLALLKSYFSSLKELRQESTVAGGLTLRNQTFS